MKAQCCTLVWALGTVCLESSGANSWKKATWWKTSWAIKRRKKRLWQHDSRFIDFLALFFFSSRVLWQSKAISEFVVCSYIPLANGHYPQTHMLLTHWSTTPCTNTWLSQWGGVFNPQIHCHKSKRNPRALACLSEWKAQATGTLIAIYRASHARRGASTERLLFCNSLLVSLTTWPLNW